MPIRLVIADDHPLVRAALAAQIGSQDDLHMCECVADGEAMLEVVRRERPDVVVLDIDMPRMGGIEAARHVRSTSPETRIVFLSACSNDSDIEAVLGVGANGYVMKGEPASALLAAIRGAARGQAWYPLEVRERLVFDDSGVRLAK